MHKAFKAIIVGFEPNLSRERLNIGVVVVVKGHPVRAKMRTSWDRICQAFPTASASALDHFARAFEERVNALGAVPPDALYKYVQKVIGPELGSIDILNVIGGVAVEADMTDRLYQIHVAHGDKS